jgi:aryl-alcohol dehydrogenase-like predicted oxidoreductase
MQQNGMLGSADVVVEAAKKLGVTPAQLAMSFALRGPRVSSLLFGTRSPEQLATNLKALELLDRDCGDVYSELVAKIPEVSEAVLIQLGEPPVGAIKLNDEERQAHIKIGK